VDEVDLSFCLLHFLAHRGEAASTKVFMPFPLRQNEKESFPNGNGCLARGTEETRSLQLIKLLLLF